MKMIVVVPEWTFEAYGPRSRAKNNPVLRKGDIIDVSNDWAKKLASRGVANVYRGKEAATDFPPVISSGEGGASAALLEVQKEIEKQKGPAGAQKDDGPDAGVRKGTVDSIKGQGL